MLKTILRSLALAGFLFIAPTVAMADPPFVEIHIGTSRPPAVRHEVRVVAPAPNYTYVPGYWDWQGSDWVWIEGRWVQPEPRASWVRARYVPEYGRYRYVPGHWSTWKVRESEDYRSWKAEHKAKRHGRGPPLD